MTNDERLKKAQDKNRPRGTEKKEDDRELDKELDDSFPASDPPSITQPAPEKEDDK